MPIPLGILAVAGAGGGVTSAFDLITTTTTSSSSVTFSGLGSYSDYKHLQIRVSGRLNTSISYDDYNVWMQINGDTGTNYAYHKLRGTGSAVVSQNGLTAEAIQFTDILPDTNFTNQYGNIIIDILDFSSSNKKTTVKALSGHYSKATNGDVRGQIELLSGLWNNTAAVTSIKIYTPAYSFSSSRISLYGIRG